MSKRPRSKSPDSQGRPSKQLEKDPASTKAQQNSVLLSYPSTSTTTQQTLCAVPFQQPCCLLTFSYTPQHVQEFNDSALRYYIDPPPNANLRYGYERWVKRPEERTRLDALLKAIEHFMRKSDASIGPGSGKAWLRDIAVVTWRGVMTKILTAPYEERDSCVLNAMLVDGTLYLEEHWTDARLSEKEDLAPRQRQQMYYGYAFESWCTSSRPGVPERLHGHPIGWGGDVDTNVQWCSVVKTKLGDKRLVIGGEVDCVRERFSGKPDNFVELKTSMSIRHAEDEARFEKKLLKFYMQSFLLGVPEIVVGFRTPQGRITTTQSFQTVKIPRLVRGKPHGWDPQICLHWGQDFLALLKTRLSEPPEASSAQPEDGPSPAPVPRVWRVILTPKLGMSIYLLDEDSVKEVQGGEDRAGFLPSGYFEQMTVGSAGIGNSGPSDGAAETA